MYKRILIPVDGSQHAKRAVEAAIDVAKRYQASVFLLHAIRNLSLPREILEMIAAGEVTESRKEILQNSAEIILGNAKDQLNAAGITDVQSKYVVGKPASKISEYAEQNKVDLIVLGHRGLGPHGSSSLGSVTRALLNITKISCLVVT
ncbi:MAG: universal stress protein [Chloroflexota bacterium]|nr:universal stress protein [Chloroflexota bacterium]